MLVYQRRGLDLASSFVGFFCTRETTKDTKQTLHKRVKKSEGSMAAKTTTHGRREEITGRAKKGKIRNETTSQRSR